MRILLVDDEEISRKPIADFLTDQLGHQVTQCEDGPEAMKVYLSGSFPMVISDIRMPGMDGISLTREIKKTDRGKFTDVVLVTGYGDMNSAVEALRAGAYDYMLKPIEVAELASVTGRISEHQSLLRENRELKDQFEEKVSRATAEVSENLQRLKAAYARVVGVGCVGIFSDRMRRIEELAKKFHQDRSVPVLIEGETGTGKEVFARLIHYGEDATTAPFVALNCSAIAPTLVETELFGYDEGAFTDARKKGSQGKLELANQGTLFLDEIGDLPLDTQPKLLRVLEEHTFYRVGGLKKISLDIRLICATNSNLIKKVEEGSFRQDLYYRLNVGNLVLPPLRERREEIGPLAQMFLEELSAKKKRMFRSIHPQAIRILEQRDWPGNIRELQNTLERIILLFDEPEVLPRHLSFLVGGDIGKNDGRGVCLDPGNVTLPPGRLNLKALEREIVQKALEKFNHNKTQTAEYLGITRSALRSKIK